MAAVNIYKQWWGIRKVADRVGQVVDRTSRKWKTYIDDICETQRVIDGATTD